MVDASATQGLRGTFTTIQDAIDQIVADGGGSLPFHTVFVRPGTYADPIVLPANVGINIIGDGPVDEDLRKEMDLTTLKIIKEESIPKQY